MNVVAEVAAAVGLAEGEEGVRDVLRAVARLEPVAVRRISRATDLPVPIVSAVCGELRKRGVVDRQRPVRLTALGRAEYGIARHDDATCGTCGGREVVVPPTLASETRSLAALARAAPAPRVELDQVHCTVATKLRRVLLMRDAGALDGRRVLLLGDDDLMAAALHVLGGRPSELFVVDVDPRVLSAAKQSLREAPFPTRTLRHDLREPLPADLRGTVDTVVTDPPYTVAGARLFLSRAAEATAGAGRRDVFLSFGPRRPTETLELQRAVAAMGFAVQRLVRNFNDYAGAGALAGTSHLYHLVTTPELRPLVEGRYDGPLYTGDGRPPVRDYRCRGCGLVRRVGRGERWATVEHSKRDPCARCGGSAFAPLPRERRDLPHGPARASSSARVGDTPDVVATRRAGRSRT